MASTHMGIYSDSTYANWNGLGGAREHSCLISFKTTGDSAAGKERYETNGCVQQGMYCTCSKGSAKCLEGAGSEYFPVATSRIAR